MVINAFDSYPKQWQTVIERARRSFRVYMASRAGFPDAVSGLEVARECLNNALSLHLEGGGAVEPGKPGKHRKPSPSITNALPQTNTSMRAWRGLCVFHRFFSLGRSLTLGCRCTLNHGGSAISSRILS